MTGKFEAPPRRRRRRRRLKTSFKLLLSLLTLGLGGSLIGLCCWATVSALSQPPEETKPGDTTPPEIFGVKDLEVYAGDTVSYLEGVRAEDSEDPAPVLEVDNRKVDLTRPGEYTILYSARDQAGNRAEARAKLRVLEWKPGYLTPEEMDRVVDEALPLILGDAQGQEAQVRKIYSWARTHLSYAGHSDRSDWRQTGCRLLQGDNTADCYGYFAVTKLLLTRLGIPNIDVQKVRNFPDDSDHFWSLVSIDGGKSFYHFDATPRVGDGDDFCLVTDEFLDRYSAANKNSHNRDKALYPATPKEAL